MFSNPQKEHAANLRGAMRLGRRMGELDYWRDEPRPDFPEKCNFPGVDRDLLDAFYRSRREGWDGAARRDIEDCDLIAEIVDQIPGFR